MESAASTLVSVSARELGLSHNPLWDLVGIAARCLPVGHASSSSSSWSMHSTRPMNRLHRPAQTSIHHVVSAPSLMPTRPDLVPWLFPHRFYQRLVIDAQICSNQARMLDVGSRNRGSGGHKRSSLGLGWSTLQQIADKRWLKPRKQQVVNTTQ
ncbi:hypothetical protein MN608_07220 [Microdochium nivale]|nr:hypothetical protein MN608_07220 [Microdochium nivale]